MTGDDKMGLGIIGIIAVFAVGLLARGVVVWDGSWAWAGPTLLILAAAGILAAISNMRGSRVAHRHGDPGERRITARHEAGHVVLAKHVGGASVKARITGEYSGYTSFHFPSGISTVDDVAVSLAGEIASGTTIGCESDHGFARAALRRAPWSRRARIERDARKYANTVLRRHKGEVTRVAAQLERTGRYGGWW